MSQSAITDAQKEIVLLNIIAKAGGQVCASESPWSWLNWFCDDAEKDTFNRCNDKGWLHTTHNSDSDMSTTTLTAEGHSAIASSAALSALTQGGVKVKELEWVQLYEKHTMHPKEWHGTGIFDARYIIKQRSRDSEFFVVGKNHKTLEAAKSAAQADYETRIRSAITLQGEPVGEFLSDSDDYFAIPPYAPEEAK